MTDATPVLIEAAINGTSTKERNPNVPITPDEQIICGTSGGSLTVWSKDGKHLGGWELPGLIWDMALAPDGRHLATANYNGTVYIIRI